MNVPPVIAGTPSRKPKTLIFVLGAIGLLAAAVFVIVVVKAIAGVETDQDKLIALSNNAQSERAQAAAKQRAIFNDLDRTAKALGGDPKPIDRLAEFEKLEK